jgi:hypothetical protein
MSKTVAALSFLAACACIALPAAAWADWDLGDPAKWTQMPDLNGWDVRVTDGFVADDFVCNTPGWVTDIHFWGSWSGGLTGTVTDVRVEFWRNDPGSAEGFSHPSTPIWGHNFGPEHVTERLWGQGAQGWYDPINGIFTSDADWPDHQETYQYNVDMSWLPLDELFFQQGAAAAPAVYWLLLRVTIAEGDPYDFGWTTSIEQNMDDAVYDSTPAVWPPTWQEVTDPSIVTAVVSLDMAFVINSVPEPGTMVLVGIAGLGLVALRRRK